MLNNLIGSKTRRALLNTFFSNPDNEYYTRQLSTLLKLSVGSIHREIGKLISARVLIAREVGNIKLFSLNKENPVYEELRAIILKTDGAIGLVKDVVSKIKGVRAAFVYGSFAKGDERGDSDIDILLIGNAVDEDRLAVVIREAEKKLFREINYTIYMEEEYKKENNKKNSFIAEVVRGKKIFIKGNENDL
jgi:predicted nucleotidyltransferase